MNSVDRINNILLNNYKPDSVYSKLITETMIKKVIFDLHNSDKIIISPTDIYLYNRSLLSDIILGFIPLSINVTNHFKYNIIIDNELVGYITYKYRYKDDLGYCYDLKLLHCIEVTV